MIAAGVNKTRKRRRCALFFFLIFFRFLLNKTENRKWNKWLWQTSKQKDSGTLPRWRIGVLLSIYTLVHRGCQYERFWSQFSLITASFLCQYINKTGFRACVKELFVQQHDPLSVSYAVLPGEKALKFRYDVTRHTNNWLWNYLQWLTGFFGI